MNGLIEGWVAQILPSASLSHFLWCLLLEARSPYHIYTRHLDMFYQSKRKQTKILIFFFSSRHRNKYEVLDNSELPHQTILMVSFISQAVFTISFGTKIVGNKRILPLFIVPE